MAHTYCLCPDGFAGPSCQTPAVQAPPSGPGAAAAPAAEGCADLDAGPAWVALAAQAPIGRGGRTTHRHLSSPRSYDVAENLFDSK
jgi:hypothetical protein